MLIFAGTGISINSLTNEIKTEIKKCDSVYFETYTSPIDDLLKAFDFDFVEASREFVEDGKKILNDAETKNVILLCYGDPMIATTHMELRNRAIDRGIDTKIFHNSSIITAIPGETGLHSYKFGRTVTETRLSIPSSLYVYYGIHANLVNKLHTVILLEYDKQNDFFITPNDAINNILSRENEQKKGVCTEDTFVIICSRIGLQNSRIYGGKVDDIIKQDFGKPPHCMIIVSELHFTEMESLSKILNIKEDNIPDNSKNVFHKYDEMLNRYIPKTRKALENAKSKLNSKDNQFSTLFVNIESYIEDAERFYNDDKYELAILSIGYAEGLLDSLSFLGKLDTTWV